MNKDNKVDGFRSTKEVLRSFLDGLLAKANDPETQNFIQEEIDSLDSEPDDSNSKLTLIVIRRIHEGEKSLLYVDGLKDPWTKYKYDVLKFLLVFQLAGYCFHHGYGAELDKNGHPTAWYLYFE